MCVRADFLIELIKYHCNKDESKFKETLLKISDVEKKKGNNVIAEKILNAYKYEGNEKEFEKKKKDESFLPSSGLTMFEPTTLVSPKEKSNGFNLFDLILPEDINQPEIILAEQVEEKIGEIAYEYGNKEIFKNMNLPVENRCLLSGPPGCGKTSTAYLLAKKLNLPLAYVRLDSLISSLLGQTGTNIRKIFEAVNEKKIILFLDEFDAIAKKRDDKHELGELKRVVNTLLQNIDNLSDEVFFIAATNHPDLLDSAVWRRFNSILQLELPDDSMREKYLKANISKFSNSEEVDWDKITKLTKGMNFSQLNELVLKTVKKSLVFDGKNKVETHEFINMIRKITFLYTSTDSEVAVNELKNLKERGLTIRDIAEITNIPKSTISDRLKEGE